MRRDATIRLDPTTGLFSDLAENAARLFYHLRLHRTGTHAAVWRECDSIEVPLFGRKALTLARWVAVVACSSGSVGCWEQMSAEWFPQMKRQPAVQTFESNAVYGAERKLAPPEGTVPAGDPRPNVRAMELAAQEILPNPVTASLESLENGQALYRRHCTACHGDEGHADGPVAGPPFGEGPFGVVVPIGGRFGLANAFSDGHIFTTITLGRGRMPSWERIPVNGRWDLINYVRTLHDPEGSPVSPAARAIENSDPSAPAPRFP